MTYDGDVLRTTCEEVNTMIASELNNMTKSERSTVLEDLHGVRDISPEECNPRKIQEKLQQMDFALRSIVDKPAFEEAQRLSAGKHGSMVNDPSFRIRFLRAERYNALEAATRMVSNLQILYETFGSVGLIRPVQLSDMMLDRENQGSDPYLFSGIFFQVMPFRDRLGRRIVVRSSNKVFHSDKQFDFTTRLKTFLYIVQELSNDIECQLKGVIMIGFGIEKPNVNPTVDKTVRRVFDTINKKISPVRIVGVHLCITDDPWWKVGSSMLIRAFPKQFRLRSRIHVGSIDECCYKLMTYGIPGDQIPIKSSGVIKINDHKRFIAYCQEREDAIFRDGKQYKGIYCPSSKDILVGRGPRIKNHIGNERYRILLQSKYGEYNSSSLSRKKEIALEVIREVHAYGGRFLVPGKLCWIEANNETARSKVSIAFRDVRKNMNSKKNRNNNNSVSNELSVVNKMNSGCL